MIDVIESGQYINGPVVHEFSSNLAKYMSVKHVIPCANGTDALQVALMALDLNPGDEVNTTDFTFAATVEVIALLNLKPILIDVDLETFNIDCDKLKKAIGPKTKAIVPVHLFGQLQIWKKLCKYPKNIIFMLLRIMHKPLVRNISSSRNKEKVGTIGDIGTTSFFPSKNLGCFGDGGALFTNNDELAIKIRGIVNHGMYKRYHHDVVGVNSG